MCVPVPLRVSSCFLFHWSFLWWVLLMMWCCKTRLLPELLRHTQTHANRMKATQLQSQSQSGQFDCEKEPYPPLTGSCWGPASHVWGNSAQARNTWDPCQSNTPQTHPTVEPNRQRKKMLLMYYYIWSKITATECFSNYWKSNATETVKIKFSKQSVFILA